MSEDEESVTQAVYAALTRGDRTELRLLLHPYLHWSAGDGVTVRGRTKVLALLLQEGPPPDPPSAVELRDGQVYRWQSG